jgi:hypothetical protein
LANTMCSLHPKKKGITQDGLSNSVGTSFSASEGD